MTRMDSSALIAAARATASAIADSTGRLWRCNEVGGGNVCFRGTGIIVTFVAERFAAGESITALADDYALPAATVEAGLRAVIRGASGRNGIVRAVERRMEAEIPAESHPSDSAPGAERIEAPQEEQP